jgi:hypothetical protein
MRVCERRSEPAALHLGHRMSRQSPRRSCCIVRPMYEPVVGAASTAEDSRGRRREATRFPRALRCAPFSDGHRARRAVALPDFTVRTKGRTWRAFDRHFGCDGDVLVVNAPTAVMNPTVPPSVIQAAYGMARRRPPRNPDRSAGRHRCARMAEAKGSGGSPRLKPAVS